MTIWNVFWKTFAQLMTAALGAALLVNWGTDYRVGALQLGLGALTAFVGGLVAAGWAYARTPASSAFEKALRSLVQWLVSGLAVLTFNSVADVTALPNVLVPLVVGAVLSFALTYFQNQGQLA